MFSGERLCGLAHARCSSLAGLLVLAKVHLPMTEQETFGHVWIGVRSLSHCELVVPPSGSVTANTV
jgi:hypothetical protein